MVDYDDVDGKQFPRHFEDSKKLLRRFHKDGDMNKPDRRGLSKIYPWSLLQHPSFGICSKLDQ